MDVREVTTMAQSSDDELANLRAQRMAQIQAQLEEQAAAQADAELQQETQQAAMAELDGAMKRILTPEARSRLASLN